MTYQLISNELQFEMVSRNVRISHHGQRPYVIELLYRPHNQNKSKWTPSIQCEALEEARRIAKAMVSDNETELTLVMAHYRQ